MESEADELVNLSGYFLLLLLCVSTLVSKTLLFHLDPFVVFLPLAFFYDHKTSEKSSCCFLLLSEEKV